MQLHLCSRLQKAHLLRAYITALAVEQNFAIFKCSAMVLHFVITLRSQETHIVHAWIDFECFAEVRFRLAIVVPHECDTSEVGAYHMVAFCVGSQLQGFLEETFGVGEGVGIQGVEGKCEPVVVCQRILLHTTCNSLVEVIVVHSLISHLTPVAQIDNGLRRSSACCNQKQDEIYKSFHCVRS